jgi:DNA-directed RNA polymerase subunit beta'
LGRVTAEDVRRASDDEVVLPRGTLIDEKIAAP